jgi:hypothetical protein
MDFSEEINIKYVIKRPKIEYLVFIYEKKIQFYPRNEKFISQFESLKLHDLIEKNKSYIFVMEENENINLIGITNLENMSPEEIPQIFQKQVYLDFKSLDEIKEEMRNYDSNYNGYIIIDNNFNFFHIEYPIDVYARLIDYELGFSDSNLDNILQILQNHEKFEDVLKYFENTEIYEIVDSLIDIYVERCKLVNLEFLKLKDLSTPKEFSQAASKLKCKNELMSLYNYNFPTLEAYWKKIQMKKLKPFFKTEMKKKLRQQEIKKKGF